MGWSDDQVRLAMMAVRASGMDDPDRYNILRQCGERAMRNGRPSVKGAALTDSDFEYFMSLVELECGGQIPMTHKDGTPFGFGEWRGKSKDGTRLRGLYIVGKIIGSLVVEGIAPEKVRGVITQAISQTVEDLGDLGWMTEQQVHTALHALRAVAKRHDIILNAGATA